MAKKTRTRRWLSRDADGLYNLHLYPEKPKKDADGEYHEGVAHCFETDNFSLIFPETKLRKGQCKEIGRVSFELL